MQAKQKIILSLGDVLIPLFGFYYLDWSLYFIALYLLLDLIGSFIFYHVKARKRIQYSQNAADKKAYKKGTLVLFLLITFVVVATHLFALITQPGINFSKAFVAFLMYVEEPIPLPQFWFLLPLLLLPPYQQYKMEFIMQQQFRTKTVQTLTSTFQNDLLILLPLLGIALATAFFVSLPQYIWLFLFIVLKLSYDLYFKPRILVQK